MFKNHNSKRKIRKIRKLTKQLKEIAEINSHLHSCIKGDGRIIDCYSDFFTKPTIKVRSRLDEMGCYREFDFLLSTPRREIAIQKTLRVNMNLRDEYIEQQKQQVAEEIRDMFIEHLAKNLRVEVMYEVLYADR